MISSNVRRALQAVASGLGSSLDEASRVPWGDTRSSYRIVLADGRILAARHLWGARSAEDAAELVRRSDRLATSGIAVPDAVAIRSTHEDEVWLLTTWVDGTVGSAVLQAPTSAVRLAEGMGRLAGELARVDSDGLEIHRQWATPGAMAAVGAEWLATLGAQLGRGSRMVAERALGEVVAAWDDGAPWRIGLSHGDFAPINVIVRSDDSLVLLDLDDLGLGPLLLDLAWWGWVVRYHHLDAWAQAWPTLINSAGLDGGPALDAAATAVARVRVVERAATAPDEPMRSMWLQRLEQTADW